MAITELNSWKKLHYHANLLRLHPINALKKEGANLAFKIDCLGISLDFSRQKMNSQTFELLLQFAQDRDLKNKIASLFRGDNLNASEHRPALHTALRHFDAQPIWVDGKDVIPSVERVREEIRIISEKIHNGLWFGYSGLPIKDVINIGIGGSDLGPRFCVQALKKYHTPYVKTHFISDADPDAFSDVCDSLNPETTLFIISSKSFTTKETLDNMKKALAWVNAPKQYMDKHFIAVTANGSKARDYGFTTILSIWSWVGGRYSSTSAINLITAIAIGFEHFNCFLKGAYQMDKHFQTRELHENMPVVMALIGLWNINFLRIPSLLYLVYSKKLEFFIPYLQQLDMESNGKSIDIDGHNLMYSTAPIIWGGLGNQAQHSYYQCLCQGTHKVAIEFISSDEFKDSLIDFYCREKMHVLGEGIDSGEPQSYIAGGVPISHLSLKSINPTSIGALISLYEHKIFAQSVLWNINAFDQPGVDSAKQLGHFGVPRLNNAFTEKQYENHLNYTKATEI